MRISTGQRAYFVDSQQWFWWYNGERWVGLPIDMALDQGIPQRLTRDRTAAAGGPDRREKNSPVQPSAPAQPPAPGQPPASAQPSALGQPSAAGQRSSPAQDETACQADDRGGNTGECDTTT